jgi:hypothetical protein
MEGHQNLIMPKEGYAYPDSLGTLTVWGILKESARVIQKHVRLLLPFVLTFTVPVSIFVAISWGSKFPYTLDSSPAIHARSLMQTSFTVTAIQQVTIVPPICLHIWLLANMSKAIVGCTGNRWLHRSSITRSLTLFFLCRNCTCLLDQREINVSVVGWFFIFMKTLHFRF